MEVLFQISGGGYLAGQALVYIILKSWFVGQVSPVDLKQDKTKESSLLSL